MKDNTKKSNISLSSYSFIFQISQMPKSLNVVAVAVAVAVGSSLF